MGICTLGSTRNNDDLLKSWKERLYLGTQAEQKFFFPQNLFANVFFNESPCIPVIFTPQYLFYSFHVLINLLTMTYTMN